MQKGGGNISVHTRLIIGLIMLLTGGPGYSLFAQNTSNQVWYTYNQQAILSSHWGYLFDINHRTSSFKTNQSVLSAARLGLTYLTDRNHRITAGYAWFGSHFKDSEKNLLTENRLWQQYQVFKKAGKTNYFHRFREEQRWRELMPQNGSKKGHVAFSFRTRYMYQHQGPIWPVTEKNKFGVWWQGATEIMLHAGEGINKHYFDQLRLIGGITLLPTRQINLAILYQYINHYRPSTQQDYNIHSIRLTLLHQLDFSKKQKQQNVAPVRVGEKN